MTDENSTGTGAGDSGMEELSVELTATPAAPVEAPVAAAALEAQQLSPIEALAPASQAGPATVADPAPATKNVPIDELSDEAFALDPSEILDDGVTEQLLKLRVHDFTPNMNVTMSMPAIIPSKKPMEDGKFLAMMGANMDELDELMSEFEVTPETGDYEEDAEIYKQLPPHLSRLRLIVSNLSRNMQLLYQQQVTTEAGRDWQQNIEHNGTVLNAGKAKLKGDESPVLRISNELGLLDLVQIPLWNSGLWVTFQTPQNTDLMQLERQMAREKITLGWASNGRIFSHYEVYTMQTLVDFALKHVYAVTMANKEPELLKANIVVTDVPQLIWGLAVSIYPGGYPLQQPCVASPGKCDHVSELLLNIARISWVDRTKFTDNQRRHMVNRTASWSPEKLKEYRDQFVTGESGAVRISETVTLQLGVPTIKESENSGFAWVDGIATATQKAFSLRLNESQREDFIDEQASLNSLRQYAHWFRTLESTKSGVPEPINDPQQLDEIIGRLCANKEMTNIAYNAILKFIDQANVNMIALPKYACPKCQKEPAAEYLKHPQLIPLDIIYVFFTLRHQRLADLLAADRSRIV